MSQSSNAARAADAGDNDAGGEYYSGVNNASENAAGEEGAGDDNAGENAAGDNNAGDIPLAITPRTSLRAALRAIDIQNRRIQWLEDLAREEGGQPISATFKNGNRRGRFDTRGRSPPIHFR